MSTPSRAVTEPMALLPEKRKRPTPGHAPAVDDSYTMRNYSVVADVAATDVEQNGLDDSILKEVEEVKEASEGDGVTRLAKALKSLAETYHRVEREKQKHAIEMEKLRMQFAKDMEIQRMEFFMDLQLHLNKIRKADVAKRPGSNVYKPSSLGNSNVSIIQESYNDPLVSLIVYAFVPTEWMESVIRSEANNIFTLPVGFMISGDGHLDHNHDMASTSSSGGVPRCSILMMFYHMLADPITNPGDNLSVVAQMNNIIPTTLLNIRSALFAKSMIM